MPSIIERLPPEVLHLVCSYLLPREARQLRFCCKTLASVGAAHGFQVIIFYLCKVDFAKLRAISEHPEISRHVKALIYVADNLRERPLSMKGYIKYTSRGAYRMTVQRTTPNWLPDTVPAVHTIDLGQKPISAADLSENYRHYKMAVEEQGQILEDKEDFDVLREVFAKLPSLETIMMDNGEFFTNCCDRISPFHAFFDYSMQSLKPEGVRQMDAILHGLEGTGGRLAQLRAACLDPSLLDKKFFDKILATCPRLNTIELFFDTSDPDVVWDDDDTKNIVIARQLVQNGIVSSFLSDLPELRSIAIGFFSSLTRPLLFPAALHNIVPRGFKWHQLQAVNFSATETERQHMLEFFELHRETLRSVQLREIRLISTSWTALLRQMKNTLTLDEVKISGRLCGRVEEIEDYPDDDYLDMVEDEDIEDWWLGDPEVPNSRECLANQLTKWFLEDGPYPLTYPRMRSEEDD